MTTNAENRGANLHFFDGSTHERQSIMASLKFEEDFVGASTVSIPAFTTATVLPWAKTIVGSATVAKTVDSAGGVMACTMTSANEAQTGAIFQKNERNFSALKGLVFEARVRAAALPTGTATLFVGVGSDYAANWADMTTLIGFSIRASGAVYLECDDATTDTSTDTGVTLAANEWATFRFEILEPGTVQFYVNGVGVGSAAFAATDATAIMQIIAQAYKAASAYVGTLEVDAVKAYANR